MSDNQHSEVYLVPGRECGTCSACCRDLAIVDVAFKKLPGIACEHCKIDRGCGIYATRPHVCRTYFCGWRSLPNMDETWRPDRSGVLITLEHRAEAGQIDSDANLILVGDPAVIARDRFASMAAGFIASGTKTYMVLPGQLGMMSYHVRLNELLSPAIAARDLAEVKEILAACLDELREAPPMPIAPELMGYAPAQAGPV